MKAIPRSLMFAGLLGVAGFAQAAGHCTVAIKGDDAMKFDIKEATVSASCPTITVELTHTGKMPAAAMGHNVVITAAKDMDAVARDGIKAGVAGNYINKADPRVIATTTLVGGGQKTRVTFPGKKLIAGGDYAFFCSFPGHSMLMKGKLVVTK